MQDPAGFLQVLNPTHTPTYPHPKSFMEMRDFSG